MSIRDLCWNALAEVKPVDCEYCLVRDVYGDILTAYWYGNCFEFRHDNYHPAEITHWLSLEK